MPLHAERTAPGGRLQRPQGRSPLLPGRLGRHLAIVAVALLIELAMAGGSGPTRFGFTMPSWTMALIAVVVFSTLLWRIRFPWPVFFITLTHGAAVAAVAPSYQPFMGVLVGLYGVARNAPRRQALLALGLTSLVWGIEAYNSTTFDDDWTFSTGWTAPLGTFAVLSGMAGAVYTFARAKRKLDEIELLRSRARESHIALRVQEDRVETARDLHDRVSNSIAATLMGLDSLSLFRDDLPPQGAKSLDLTRSAARQSMHEIRDVLAVLRAADAPLEDDDDLHPDLEGMLVELQRSGVAGIEVEVTHKGDVVKLGDEVQECAALCIREAVTNAAKYGVSQTEIGIDWRDDPILITVRNANGERQLPDTSMRGGLGLGGIIDRVTSLGGSVSLDAEADVFTLRLQLPRE